MSDEVKTRVSIEGADQAVSDVKRLVESEKKLLEQDKALAEWANKVREGITKSTDAVKDGGREAVAAASKYSSLKSAMDGILSSVQGLIGGLVGTAGLVAAFRAQNEQLQENARLSNEVARSQLDLLFLNQGFKPGDIAVVDDVANMTGQSRASVGQAFGQFKSKTSNLNDDQRLGFFRELAQTALTTEAPIGQLVPLFAQGSLYVNDPNRLQNIVRKTQELSPEASPQALAKLLPEVLPFAGGLNLKPEEIAGLAVTAMTVSGSPDKGITALRNILLTLGGGGTDEQKALMEELGAPTSMGTFKQLAVLSGAQKTGGLGIEKMTGLVGKENAQVFLSMLQNPDLLRNNVSAIVAAGQGSKDLTEEAIVNIIGGSEQQKLRLQTEQATARIEGLKSKDVGAQKTMLARKLMEEEMIRRGYSPSARTVKLTAFDVAVFGGASAERAVELSEGFGDDLSDVVSNRIGQGPMLDAQMIGDNIDPELLASELRKPEAAQKTLKEMKRITIVNYNNSFINTMNPAKAPDDVKRQD